MTGINNKPKKKPTIFNEMIGKLYNDVVNQYPDWSFRIYHINREPMLATADYNTNRLNVDVIGSKDNYIISKVIGFG